jgi:hypothetical protein
MNRCATLGIDSGAISGAALAVPADVVPRAPDPRRPRQPEIVLWARTVRTAVEREDVIVSAREDARVFGLELVVVGERWTGVFRGKRAGARTISGLGASWGKWAEQLELAGVPKRRVLRVSTAFWRARMIPGTFARSTEEWKAAARAIVGRRWPELALDSDDAAEAALDVVDQPGVNSVGGPMAQGPLENKSEPKEILR